MLPENITTGNRQHSLHSYVSRYVHRQVGGRQILLPYRGRVPHFYWSYNLLVAKYAYLTRTAVNWVLISTCMNFCLRGMGEFRHRGKNNPNLLKTKFFDTWPYFVFTYIHGTSYHVMMNCWSQIPPRTLLKLMYLGISFPNVLLVPST
jgi:hypothetical protein